MLSVNLNNIQNKISKIFFAKYSILAWLLLICLIFFGKNLFGMRITTWDTHDLGFVNFLYFSDALKSGYIPFWNPYIQSGVFFPSLNNIGLYTIFQLPFVFISWIFNPAIVFEWMIQSYIIFGGLGVYLYFLEIKIERSIAILGSTAYVLSVLIYFTGQYGFIVSLSILPWMLYLYHKIENNKLSVIQIILIGTLIGMYFSSGYPWMNFVNLTIFILYVIIFGYKKNKILSNIIYQKIFLLIIFILIIYILLLLPALMNINFNYSLFSGDFYSYEPRLRSLGIQAPQLLYNTIFDAIIGSIDFNLYGRNLPSNIPLWFKGIGLIVFAIFIFTLFNNKIKIDKFQIFWFVIVLFFLLYSSAVSVHIISITNYIPFFNSNRWFGLGIIYVSIGLIFISIYKFNISCKGYYKGEFILFSKQNIIILLLSIILIMTNKPASYFMIFLLLLMPIYLPYLLKKFKSMMIFVLIFINIITFYKLHNHTYWITSASLYTQQINNRNIVTEYTNNNRDIYKSNRYIYNNQDWILKKIPSTHGYNNLGNPWYWYFKNHNFTSNIISVTRDLKLLKEASRKDFNTDNQFYDDYVKQIDYIQSNVGIFKEDYIKIVNDGDFKFNIINILTTPNSTKVNLEISDSSIISFNTIFTPGWNIYVNGKKSNLIKTNGFFMGVYLDKKGLYNIEFKFEPYLIYYIFAIVYSIIIILLFLSLIEHKKRKIYVS